MERRLVLHGTWPQAALVGFQPDLVTWPHGLGLLPPQPAAVDPAQPQETVGEAMDCQGHDLTRHDIWCQLAILHEGP